MEGAIFLIGAPGLPIGSPLSPLMADLYLSQVDFVLEGRRIMRYADNFIAFSSTEDDAVENLNAIREAVESLSLGLNQKKTWIAKAPPLRSLFQ